MPPVLRMRTDKMERIKIGFYGYGTRALDALMEHKDFEVKYFLAPESRIDKACHEAEAKYRDYFKMEQIKNRKELAGRIADIHDVECFLMNASPIILDHTILDHMDFYNIHPGNLHSNRGHHPHLWSILLDEKETEINLHKVETEIDLGTVIECILVPVLPGDTSQTLLDRAEDEVPRLLDTLASYLRGECAEKGVVKEGGYRRKMTYEDYRMDAGEDSWEVMDRKIRARAMHSGGFFEVGNRRVYVDRMIERRQEGTGGPVLTEGPGTLTLTREGETIVFGQSKQTDTEGNVLWKRE